MHAEIKGDDFQVEKKVPKTNMRKLPKRVSATKNFVFEFSPEENCPELGLSNIPDKLPVTRKLPRRNVVKGKSQGLPKLRAIDSSTNQDARIVNLEYYSSYGTLPQIRKGEGPRILDDQNVGQAKTKWQILKAEKNWCSRKNANSQTRKLHEALKQINGYGELSVPRYAGNKIDYLNNSRCLSVEDELARIEEEIFPQRYHGKSGGDASSEELQRRLRREKITGSSFKSSTLRALKKSNFDEEKSDEIFVTDTEVDAREKMRNYCRTIEKISAQTSPGTDFEKYLEKYDASQEQRNREPEVREPSSSRVAEILAGLNIEHPDSSDENADIPEVAHTPRIKHLSANPSIDTNHEWRDYGTELDKKKMKDVGTGSCGVDTADLKLGVDTFLKMALKRSRGQIPRHFESGILKSNYLRSESDLYPV